MMILGYVAAILIGVSLGLIGSGGSILTVPVLVYLFAIDPVMATAYSLFIVGTTSAVGSISYFKKGLVNIKTVIVFGIPSVIAVFLTRAYIIPNIPDKVFSLGNLTVTKNLLLMLLFAIIMILASLKMIITNGESKAGVGSLQKFNYPLILLEGLLVGTITGLVGAGGGFLIIPALVLLSKLPMKEAVGTSLMIIAAKSLIGFLGEPDLAVMDWEFLSLITVIAAMGIIFGSLLANRINGKKLKPAFGWFVLVMGIYIIIRESVI